MGFIQRTKSALTAFRHAYRSPPDLQIGPERQGLILQKGPQYSDWLWEQIYGDRNSALPAIARARAVIVGSLLSCEMRVVRDTDDPSAAQPEPSHPINNFFDAPSRIMSGPEFWRQYFDNYARGNAYAFVRQSPDGLPIELVPVACRKTTIVGNAISRRGVSFRHYLDPMFGDSFPEREYWDDRHVLHSHWPNTFQASTYKSLPPIAGYAAQVVQNNQLLQQHYTRKLSRPLSGSGVITTDPSMVDRYKNMTMEDFIEQGEQFGKTAAKWLNEDIVPVLPPGVNVAPGIDNIDLKALEIVDLTVDEVAREYGVPPNFLYRYQIQSFRALEQENVAFARRSIYTHAQGIGGELTRKLLTREERIDGLRIEVSIDRIELGTLTERIAAAVALATDGALGTPNEGRDLLDMPPIEGGDELRDPRGGPMTNTPQEGVIPEAQAQQLAQQLLPYLTSQNGHTLDEVLRS